MFQLLLLFLSLRLVWESNPHQPGESLLLVVIPTADATLLGTVGVVFIAADVAEAGVVAGVGDLAGADDTSVL